MPLFCLLWCLSIVSQFYASWPGGLMRSVLSILHNISIVSHNLSHSVGFTRIDIMLTPVRKTSCLRHLTVRVYYLKCIKVYFSIRLHEKHVTCCNIMLLRKYNGISFNTNILLSILSLPVIVKYIRHSLIKIHVMVVLFFIFI